MQQTVLILTSKTGGGHISLAEALRDHLQPTDNSTQIHIIDPQAGFFHWHYRFVSRYALWLWSAEFQLTNTPGHALFAHRIFAHLVGRRLHAIIQRLHPDMIITTYPFLTYEVMHLLEKQRKRIPFVMLFTDPVDVHASWLTEKRATAVLAPTVETYQQAKETGFSATQLHQVGWPVRAQFTRVDPGQRADLLHSMALDPQKFTIFLQGGGEGAAQFGHTVERLLSVNPDLQIILATGTNQALQTHFRQVKNIYPLPFTKDIATYMAAADVIMGKAGPNMLFEAITLGKPFIATTYIPGQEEANLAFIQQHQLGWIALTLPEQQQLLQKLVVQRELLHQMAVSVATYQQQNNTQNESLLPILKRLLSE